MTAAPKMTRASALCDWLRSLRTRAVIPTLSATSVGITARVLKDLNQSQSAEARVILGAAVIDDVLGLIILAVVTGLIASADQGERMSYGSVAIIFTKAALFLAGALALGVYLAPRVFHFASQLRARGVLLGVGLAICFLSPGSQEPWAFRRSSAPLRRA